MARRDLERFVSRRCRPEERRMTGNSRSLALLRMTTSGLLHRHLFGTILLLRRGGECYLEHAVIERRLDLIRVDPFRKGKRAIEQFVALFRVKEPLPILLMLLVLLARDREYAVVDLDANVALLCAGNVGAYDELVASPESIELGKETGASALIRIASRL